MNKNSSMGRKVSYTCDVALIREMHAY